MTPGTAKSYVLDRLPCTTSAVIDLFLHDLEGYLVLDKLIGMNPQSVGYNTLVFHFHLLAKGPASTEPIQRYLQWWFKNKLHGKVLKFNEGEEQVWWVSTAVEIKEDRDSLYLPGAR